MLSFLVSLGFASLLRLRRLRDERLRAWSFLVSLGFASLLRLRRLRDERLRAWS